MGDRGFEHERMLGSMEGTLECYDFGENQERVSCGPRPMLYIVDGRRMKAGSCSGTMACAVLQGLLLCKLHKIPVAISFPDGLGKYRLHKAAVIV